LDLLTCHLAKSISEHETSAISRLPQRGRTAARIVARPNRAYPTANDDAMQRWGSLGLIAHDLRVIAHATG